jgi:hypothetical protein
VVNGKGLKFEVSGLARRHWSNAGPIRAIFRDAFALARLTYFNPHSFRKALAQLGTALPKYSRSVYTSVVYTGVGRLYHHMSHNASDYVLIVLIAR